MTRRSSSEMLFLKLGKAAAIGAMTIAVVVLIAVFWPSGKTLRPAPVRPDRVTVTLAGQPFQMELAITESQVEHGLMGRATLAENSGMLFVFADAQVRTFWMKNCLIDLDIIFLDAHGRIISIHSLPAPSPGAEPARCISAEPAQFTIEVAAGTAERFNLHPGDRVEMDLARLKQLVR